MKTFHEFFNQISGEKLAETSRENDLHELSWPFGRQRSPQSQNLQISWKLPADAADSAAKHDFYLLKFVEGQVKLPGAKQKIQSIIQEISPLAFEEA